MAIETITTFDASVIFIPVFKFFIISLAVFGGYNFLNNVANLFARAFKDKLDNIKDIHFKNKDVEVVSDAFKQIGEVKKGTPNEIILNAQNKENNIEIYGLDRKYDNLDKRLERIEYLIHQLNIHQQMTISEVKNDNKQPE